MAIFGVQTIASNGFVGFREGILYFAVISGVLCIGLAVAAFKKQRWAYYGLIANLSVMAVVLPAMAQKIMTGNFIVQIIIALKDPLGWVIIIQIILLIIGLIKSRVPGNN